MAAKKVQRPKEVFLSYAHQDQAFVTKLGSILADHGVKVWYSKRNIQKAQWHNEIGAALKRCDWFVVVLTPAAVKSTWVQRELVYALNQARFNDRITPLLRKKCNYEKLSWTLDSFQRFDFTKKFDDGCAELLKTWQIAY